MSFNICRGTLGSLATFTAIRNASSHVSRLAGSFPQREMSLMMWWTVPAPGSEFA